MREVPTLQPYRWARARGKRSLGGSHLVSIEKQGFVAYRQDLSVQQGNETQLDARLVPSQDFVEGYRDRTGFVRTLAWIGLGVGAAGIASGAGILVAERGEARDLDADVAAYNV